MSWIAPDHRMIDTSKSPKPYHQPETDMREIKKKNKYCKPLRFGSCSLYGFTAAQAD